MAVGHNFWGMAKEGTLSPGLLSPRQTLCSSHPLPFCVPLQNLSQALGHFTLKIPYKEDKIGIFIPILQKEKRLRDLLHAQNLS